MNKVYDKKIEEMFEKYKKEQQKKNRKHTIIILIICLFLSGITSVSSYNMIASSVGYTPKDANWQVENTSDAIDNLFDSVGSALVGSVYSYMGVNAPAGYLACDGTVYEISKYQRLANHIKVQFGSYNFFGGDGETTFAVPDLRGEFLRGTGTNSYTNQGSGESVGVHQDGTKHNYSPSYGTRAYKEYWASTVDGDSSTYKRGVYDEDFIRKPAASETIYYENWTTKNITSFAMGTNHEYVRTYYTSRPTNTSVLFIIKY